MNINSLTVNPNHLFYILVGFLLIAILIVLWMWRMHVRMSNLLRGKDAKSLEDSVITIINDLKDFEQFTKDMEQYLSTVERRLKKSIQSVETVRFNPFKGTGSGGNNSFSAAFVNEYGNGVVLTSMYSRDRISMFGKPLKNFASEYELSEEERAAIEQAKGNLGKAN